MQIFTFDQIMDLWVMIKSKLGHENRLWKGKFLGEEKIQEVRGQGLGRIIVAIEITWNSYMNCLEERTSG